MQNQAQCSPCAAKLTRGSNTVSSRILAVRAPTSVRSDAQFTIEVDIETYGTGADKQFLAIYDSDAAKYIAAGKSNEPYPPGQRGTWTGTMNPLDNWYTNVTGRPIPSTLRWIARVGYVTRETEDGFEGMITDERSLSILVEPVVNGEEPWWKRKIFGIPVVYLAAGGAVAVGVVAVVVVRK